MTNAAARQHDRLDEGRVLSVLRSPRLFRREALAGLVVALALIPEAISFSVLAGVDPRVGLFATFTMAVSIAFLGGRPAMITGATGAIALVIAPVARDHGLDYLLATVILGGILQIVFGLAGTAQLMRLLPRSVMVGFVNALAILIFMAQLPYLGVDLHDGIHLGGVPWIVYPMVVVGIVIMVLLPKVTNIVPAPLVAIVLLTALVMSGNMSVPNVSDEGELPRSLPSLLMPDVPLNFETLQIIAPYAFAVAMVGLLESLMTAKLVDDITDTHSNKSRESWGQGAANVITGFFGGMGGCAMIGQTMINVKASGARSRVSTFLAGVLLLALVVGAGDLVGRIPMAALVAVMIIVAVGTFDWHSIAPSTLKRLPKSENLVMLTTVVGVVATHNLAIGVTAGVILAFMLFARRVYHLVGVHRELITDDDGSVHARYTVTGELFFASSNDMVYQFEYTDDPDRVVIDLTRAHLWDASTVAALDAISTKYDRKGKLVQIVGLNEASSDMHERLSGRLSTH